MCVCVCTWRVFLCGVCVYICVRVWINVCVRIPAGVRMWSAYMCWCVDRSVCVCVPAGVPVLCVCVGVCVCVFSHAYVFVCVYRVFFFSCLTYKHMPDAALMLRHKWNLEGFNSR